MQAQFLSHCEKEIRARAESVLPDQSAATTWQRDGGQANYSCGRPIVIRSALQ
jgi:hypothetical protein